MNFEYAGLTDPGLLRENNEDAVSINSTDGVVVLADGMGGYSAGEVASSMAVNFVRVELSRWLREAGEMRSSEDVTHAIGTSVVSANQAIYRAASANSQYRGMGTTVVVGVFEPGRVLLGHVGDSRCYVWRRGTITQLTRDHSLLQEQLEAGLLTAEQAKLAAHKHLVTRALGVEAHVLVDVQVHRPEIGDIYLICSDGLTDMIDDEELAVVLGRGIGLYDRAAHLIQMANEAGGRDNISVILIRVKAEPSPQGFFSRILRRA